MKCFDSSDGFREICYCREGCVWNSNHETFALDLRHTIVHALRFVGRYILKETQFSTVWYTLLQLPLRI